MLYEGTKYITANIIQDSVVNDNSSLSSLVNTIEINDTEPSTSPTIPSNHDPSIEPIMVINPNSDSRIEDGMSEEQIEIEDSENNDKDIVTVDRNHTIIHETKLAILQKSQSI